MFIIIFIIILFILSGILHIVQNSIEDNSTTKKIICYIKRILFILALVNTFILLISFVLLIILSGE